LKAIAMADEANTTKIKEPITNLLRPVMGYRLSVAS